MSALPTMAVRNAIAYVAARGNFPSNVQIGTRIEAQRHGVEFAPAAVGTPGPLRFYEATEEGRAIAARGTLAPALAWAAERGFIITPGRRGREHKPNFIPIHNPETDVEGFISGASRVFLPKEGTNHVMELAFTAKAGGAK